MRLVLFIFIISTFLTADTIKSGYWEKGQTLLTFFEEFNIPQKLYYSLPQKDQESAASIQSGTRYFVAKDDNDRVTQLLLPISDELQIRVYFKDDKYHFTTTPISYTTMQDTFVITLENSPYYDIVKHTGLKELADEFVAIFKHSINFSRNIRKGDKLVISYKQNMRLGKPHGKPEIKMAMIETNKRPHYLINYNDRYYNKEGTEVQGFRIIRPVAAAHSWISSHYSKKRWHPILKRYRAHLGVDFAANSGTRIKAAASGRVVFKGRKGGYGNTIIIDHGNGFRTLYGHMKGFRSGIYNGKRVYAGHTIGYVGSTGLSTGPHLHLELQRRGQRINPLNVVKVATDKLSGEEKKRFNAHLQTQIETINQAVAANRTPDKIEILPDSQQTTLVAQHQNSEQNL